MKRINKKKAEKIKSKIVALDHGPKNKLVDPVYLKEFILSIKNNLPNILISAFAILCLFAANLDILFIAIIIIAIFFLYGIFNK